ncbi:MAG: phosphoribosyl-ATP diphosphatase [Clostridiales bacterium]|nr:phosphoribosyl-ATP diphosphatase [Clostridiales bacterium]
MKKQMIPCLYLQYEKAVTGFGQRNLFGDGDVEALGRFYGDKGADGLLIFDFSSEEQEHERAIKKIGDICRAVEIPVMTAGNIKCMDDIKKLIYAGCAKVILNFSKESNILLLEEASRRFGKEKMVISISSFHEFTDNQELIEKYSDGILALDSLQDEIASVSRVSILIHTDEGKEEELLSLLKGNYISGLSGAYISSLTTEIRDFKERCREENISVAREAEKNDRTGRTGRIAPESFSESPFSFLQEVYNLIFERKENPQEGSYINYLFDKGTDKILKKIGEECTDLVIAAKNENKEEITCEISDLLYHIMVLMAEKEIFWEDIAEELTGK